MYDVKIGDIYREDPQLYCPYFLVTEIKEDQAYGYLGQSVESCLEDYEKREGINSFTFNIHTGQGSNRGELRDSYYDLTKNYRLDNQKDPKITVDLWSL